MAEISETENGGWEKEIFAKHGNPLRCPKCGATAFRRTTLCREELFLLSKDGDWAPYVFDTSYYDGADEVSCAKCDYSGMICEIIPGGCAEEDE